MFDVRKIIKNILSVIIASLLTIVIYLFTSIFWLAAINDTVGSASPLVNAIEAVIMLICEIIFCGLLIWVQHIKNDASIRDFMKEYRDIKYTGIKSDITRAIKSNLGTYVFNTIIMGACLICAVMNLAVNIFVVFMPLVGLMIVMHPLVGFIVNWLIFTVLYTFFSCLLRKKWAEEWMKKYNS